MRYVTKKALLNELQKALPNDTIEVLPSLVSEMVIVKLNGLYYDPYDFRKITGINLFDVQICSDNLDLWKDLTFK